MVWMMIRDHHTSYLQLGLLRVGNFWQYHMVQYIGSEEEGEVSSKRTQFSHLTYRQLSLECHNQAAGEGYLGLRGRKRYGSGENVGSLRMGIADQMLLG
jgi:hypothetical protein